MKTTALIWLSLLLACAPLLAGEPDLETFTRSGLDQSGAVDAARALQLQRGDLFSGGVNSPLLIHGLPALVLVDGYRIDTPLTQNLLGVAPLDPIPLAFIRAVAVENSATAPAVGVDAPGGVVDVELNRNYVGGEAGVFFGTSAGSFGGQAFQSYITGGLGNDRTSVNFGASYGSSSFRLRR